MYEKFFKFNGRPFPFTPQTRTYFPAVSIESARQTLCRLVERSEGVGLVIGAPGTGKTLLCQMLTEQFQGTFSVALLATSRQTTTQALLQMLMYELGLPYRGLNEGELRLSLVDYLEPTPGGNGGLLLLLDEAHLLSWRLLEEVRLITNLVRNGQPRVRLVLAGGPSLEERLANPKLGSFSQRVGARCYLQSLDRAETIEYVRTQIAFVGGDADRTIDDEALQAVHRATEGVPRLINQVCDHALLLSSLGGQRRLNSEAIEEAWADLQQLPTRWTPNSEKPISEIVEFGRLDEELEELEAIRFPMRTGTDLTTLHVSDAEEQLEAITEQLEAIDSPPPPVMPTTTEVELDFPEFVDPFTEQFLEEEVVLDHYTSDADIFANVPRVTSREGRQLSSLLGSGSMQPWPSRADRHNIQAEAEATPLGDDEVWGFAPASDPVLPDEPPLVIPKPEHNELRAESQVAARPLSLKGLTGPTSSAIVVEDEPGRESPRLSTEAQEG